MTDVGGRINSQYRVRYSEGRVSLFCETTESLVEVGDSVLETSRISRRDLNYLIKIYSILMLAFAMELAEGVVREVQAGAGKNAMRLARHIWEADLALTYVSDLPGVRLDQALGSDAKNRLKVLNEVQSLRVSRATYARHQQAAANNGLPNLRDMAMAVDERRGSSERTDEYSLKYRWASARSHSGLTSLDDHLGADSNGRFLARRSGRSIRERQMALDIAIHALSRIVSAGGLRTGVPVDPIVESLCETASAPLKSPRVKTVAR